jgi:hypothetical protein
MMALKEETKSQGGSELKISYNPGCYM